MLVGPECELCGPPTAPCSVCGKQTHCVIRVRGDIANGIQCLQCYEIEEAESKLMPKDTMVVENPFQQIRVLCCIPCIARCA